MVSSAYLRILILFLVILIPASILTPACASSSLAFRRMYSAYKLKKQSDNIQLWSTPFPIWNQSVVTGLVLTVASWPAFRFLRRQVRWSHIPISWRMFHSLLWSTQSRALSIFISRSRFFFWYSFAFSMIQRMLAIWSLVPLPCLNPEDHLEVHGSHTAEAWLEEF